MRPIVATVWSPGRNGTVTNPPGQPGCHTRSVRSAHVVRRPHRPPSGRPRRPRRTAARARRTGGGGRRVGGLGVGDGVGGVDRDRSVPITMMESPSSTLTGVTPASLSHSSYRCQTRVPTFNSAVCSAPSMMRLPLLRRLMRRRASIGGRLKTKSSGSLVKRSIVTPPGGGPNSMWEAVPCPVRDRGRSTRQAGRIDRPRPGQPEDRGVGRHAADAGRPAGTRRRLGVRSGRRRVDGLARADRRRMVAQRCPACCRFRGVVASSWVWVGFGAVVVGWVWSMGGC
jgi:hypothetical protein